MLKKSLLTMAFSLLLAGQVAMASQFYIVIPFSGKALPNFTASPNSISFGYQALGATVAQDLVITNTGNTGLSGATIALEAGAPDFVATNNCGVALRVGESCVVNVAFKPSAQTVSAGTMRVGYKGVPPQLVPLAGVGAADVLGVTPAAQPFGGVQVGSYGQKSFVLRNTGQVATSLGFGALPPAVTRGGDCAGILLANSTCTVVLTYTPVDASVLNTSVPVTGAISSAAMGLTGYGILPAQAQLNPLSYDFGSVAVGAVATSDVVTLAAAGGLPLSGLAITPPAGYSLNGNTCGANLAVGASCTFRLNFSPTAGQVYSGNVVVASNAPTVNLGVSGTAVATTTSVASLSFTAAYVGTTSVSQPVTVTNTGAAAVAVSAPTVGTTNFTVAHNCPASLVQGASCVVNVASAPKASGVLVDLLTIVTGAGTKTVSLSGEGVAPSVTALVVAGGGGGGQANGNYAGGGGAGGLLQSSVTVALGTPYPVTVGAGGDSAANGQNSSFASLTTAGGGAGASYTGAGVTGNAGGSGGGGAPTYGDGGNGAAGQGNRGGNSSSANQGGSDSAGGGGGGAGSGGYSQTDYPYSNTPGTGGEGIQSDISGALAWYAAGGSGSGTYVAGRQNGIGGAASGVAGWTGSAYLPWTSGAGYNGTENTGSGGAAGRANLHGGANIPGTGGAGVVIISQPAAAPVATTTGAPVVTVVGAKRIYKFNASGTIKF